MPARLTSVNDSAAYGRYDVPANYEMMDQQNSHMALNHEQNQRLGGQSRVQNGGQGPSNLMNSAGANVGSGYNYYTQ